ncbi:BAG family molecular chaperone regulator 2-like [Olea europaea var. sylvestris]|uniref:BAG family molecular chaperone regulator 2-like n=1 Tax=Olea europaea subsp. europaea TaxID=158383 RepID=A0A8S0VL85_OLEEU|nr:BAG family molecular chaperone regulator 2-like [Olea europaea var. sylvestris]CAA3033122.1 BAG family molecular chaperone regulator 2-like [Olea europaea subsp. europaea]
MNLPIIPGFFLKKEEEMIKRRLDFNGGKYENAATTSSCGSKEEEVKWEMRPGGMLVQQRSENFGAPPPKLRIRVAYGALRYEIAAHSLATFGELKKLLTAETGLQPGEQRIIFRGKERENGEYLDICGVKDRSKVILIEDPESIERRFIEMRRNAKIQTVHRLINDVSEEVDKLAKQVSAIEKSIAIGNKVAELQITTLTEMLMRQAVKLDSISTEGDACALKDFQGKRVQKCVETLDHVLKVSSARAKPVIVTTKWETFDPLCNTTTTNWQLFD